MSDLNYEDVLLISESDLSDEARTEIEAALELLQTWMTTNNKTKRR